MKKMSEFNKRHDQAEKLRTKMIDDYKEQHGNYPPRGEVHRGTVKKTKLKMKYPVISLLALFFILLPVLFLSIYFYHGNGGKLSANGNYSPEGETVFISNQQHLIEEPDAKTMDEELSTPQEEEASTEGVKKITTKDVDQKIQGSQSNTLTTDTSIESSKSKESEYREVKTHRVAAGETLFKIAIQYYNSRSGEEIIRQYNGIEANNIYEGQVLKIPLK